MGSECCIGVPTLTDPGWMLNVPNDPPVIHKPGFYVPIVGWVYKLADGGCTYSWWIHALLDNNCTIIINTYNISIVDASVFGWLRVQKRGPNHWGLHSYSIQDTWTGCIGRVLWRHTFQKTIPPLILSMYLWFAYENLLILHCQIWLSEFLNTRMSEGRF